MYSQYKVNYLLPRGGSTYVSKQMICLNLVSMIKDDMSRFHQSNEGYLCVVTTSFVSPQDFSR